MPPVTVGKWRRSFAERGVAGFQDTTRPVIPPQCRKVSPYERFNSKYPPAKPGALVCEPLKAAAGSLTRPRKTTGDRDVLTCGGALLNLPGQFLCYTLWEFAMFLETPT
jgi:hypothetical protein